MKVVEKKCHPEYFQAILDGRKNFELRLADWSCKPKDILILREWNPKTNQYTGRMIRKEVGYIIKTKDVTFFPKQDIQKYGFQIISLVDPKGNK